MRLLFFKMKTNTKTTIRQKIGLIFLGLFLSLVIIEIFLRPAGSAIIFYQHSANKIPDNIEDITVF